jgi:hypothetical protein
MTVALLAIAILYANCILTKKIENSGQIFYNNPILKVVLIPEGCKAFKPEKELPVFVEYPANMGVLTPEEREKTIADLLENFFHVYRITDKLEKELYRQDFKIMFRDPRSTDQQKNTVSSDKRAQQSGSRLRAQNQEMRRQQTEQPKGPTP